MSECLSESELRQFHAGTLDTAVRQRVEGHLATCEQCRRREIELRRPDDALFQQLHEANETPSQTQTSRGEAPPSIPQRIGQYRIKRVIASGGMGTVYEAMQEQPRRVVALKVMKAGIASKSALRRFEYESQILARLRHPNIAQVYEAGTAEVSDQPSAVSSQQEIAEEEFAARREGGAGATSLEPADAAEGSFTKPLTSAAADVKGRSPNRQITRSFQVPFFAMEYIPNARPITEHAKERKLGTKERL